jgi:hypothetical protein
MDSESRDGPAEIELAWEEEILRRLGAFRHGETTPVPAEEVFAKARNLLK